MLRKTTRRFLVYASGIPAALVGALLLLPVPILRANPGPDGAASSEMFRTKCEMCHGQDGAGSTVGKSMNVPDLRSPAVRNLPDAELAQIISNGKGGMSSFKSSLSGDQIHGLVTHIRSLHQKK
jgi:mono/diheme cytochrome c family protein